MNRIENLWERQIEFQRLAKFDICSPDEDTRNKVSEIYLFKAMEEIFETLKTFPSGLIPISKSRPIRDPKRIRSELSDVVLYLLNFCINEGITPVELLDFVEDIQTNNFRKLYEKLANERAQQL